MKPVSLYKAAASIGIELFQRYPKQFLVALGCLIASSLAEGIGFLSLLPAIELLMSGDGVSASPIAQGVKNFLASLGLPVTPGVLMSVFVLALIVKSLLAFLGGVYFSFTVSGVTLDLRLRLVSGLSRARWQYFSSLQTGKLANTISNEAQEAEVVAKQILTIMSGTVQTLVYVTAAAIISLYFTVVSVLAGLAMIWALNGLVRMARNAGQWKISLLRSYVVHLVEWLSNMKPLKAMGLDSAGETLLQDHTNDLFRAQKRLVLANQSISALQEPLMAATLAGTLIFSIEYLQIAPAAMAVNSVLFLRTVAQFGVVQNAIKGVAASEAAYHGIRDNILEVEAEVEQQSASEPQISVGNRPPEIRFSQVRFGYDDTTVLDDLSLTFERGTLTALVGASGAGKSTCLDIIAGLVSPGGGAVLIDGGDMKHVAIRAWRSRIGYVPQEMTLLHDTIRNNLTLGDERIEDARIFEALDAAGATDFVRDLPLGLETLVGERGQRFSGGQRQRLAIARALVRRPSVLLLDEATSALDADTEHDICARLSAMRGEITIIATSHRPAIEQVANQVIRLRYGRVAEAPSKFAHENGTDA